MKTKTRPLFRVLGFTFLAGLCAMLFASRVGAALVGPAGYTNDFASQPAATDWATLSITGNANDGYTGGTMETEVNASITAAAVTNQTTSSEGDPPMQLTTAVWSSTAFYLQTRPTGNRYNVLMGKFLNQSGTNATQITISYLFTQAGAGATEDIGIRAYYSLTGTAGSWVNIPGLNSLAFANGSATLSTNVTVNWTNGGNLFLLWADDNAQGTGMAGTDSADEYDNFSLQISAGQALTFTALVTAPTNTQLYVSGTAITAAAAVASGTSPYTLQYFTNSGAGNTVFASAGSSATPPYNVSLGTLVPGAYNIYAVVTDSLSASTNTLTNAFFVANPIVFNLTAPLNNASYADTNSVIASTTVSGGTPPYSVQFFVDNVPSGSPVVAFPFERNLGTLFVGDHAIRAVVTDSKGWVSNSLVSIVHISGALAATLTPTDGTIYNYGQSVTLTGLVAGGTAPYTATFFVNGQSQGTLSSPPFTATLGVLAPGSYTSYVHATDSAIPSAQNNSTTNIITILANPVLVNLTSPGNGQSGVANQPIALTATASVNSPLGLTNVQFYYNGVLTGADSTSPYTVSVASPAEGAGAFYAVATDTLGRRGTSAVATVTFVLDPLGNNDFANAFLLGTPATVTGNNTGATIQQQEPQFQFGGGLPTIVWGATLWWKWIAPFNGTVTIDTFGSSINTVLSVYTGSAVNQLAVVGRNDNAPGLADVSLVSFTATAGTEYQIQVGGASAGGPGSQSAQGPIQLNLAMPPFVAITNPIAGSTFLVGSNISVDAIAAPTVGTVTNVSLYRGATFLGSANVAPYSFVVSNAPAGTNAFYAVARDSIGQVGTSAVVRVLVANVGITITSPLEDAIFTGTNPITVAVFGIVPGSAITNVDFFIDGTLLGQDATAPFSVTWSNLSGGSHRLTATGRDSLGNSYVATPVNFGVGAGLVRSNSVWKYLDNGSDQGTAWIAPGFDDSSWSSGASELGYGDTDEATVVNSGPAGAFFITTYFRRAFTATNLAALTNLILALEYDDGGVVYLNGREIYRTANVPAGQNYLTTTTGQAGEDTTDFVLINPTNLVEGVNVLAVEIHQQAANSSDISFNLDLLGVPIVIHNVSPEVVLNSPTNGQFYVAPLSITNSASASDSDGSVRRVEFFADGVKIGEATNGNPYEFVWNTPPVGAHVITAVAVDDQNGRSVSAPISIVIYNGAGTPVAAITSPANGAVMEGPTNLLVSATANAINGVTNVQFLANGVVFGNDATAPYSAFWTSSFLSNGLQAVVFDANGVRGTSALVSVTITIPPTNLIAPTISTQAPPPFATITNLTNLTVVFSERVQNVTAGDLLVNGLPATGVSGSGSNYTFSFPRPPYGQVDIAFATGHGITDFGFPDNLPFNEFADDARWGYTLIDTTPPQVLARTPARGATVTNLFEVAVTFSEPVIGVNETDLLVNGVPAFAFSGSGSSYVFSVSQPASGTINITWAVTNNIFDLADLPNAFVRTATNNLWSFTLDSRTRFVQSNSVWRFIKGLAEASSPTNAWRQIGFDDSSWSNSAAPFFYGDPYTNFPAGIVGTHLTDMRSNYSSIYLRKEFVVENRNIITNLVINAQGDDGYIAWINGVEVRRFNAPAVAAYNSVAVGTATEQNSTATYVNVVLTNNPVAALVNGTNILAIQAFNNNTNDGDFGFNAQLYSFVPDFNVVPPRVAFSDPFQGDIFYFTNVTITFSEAVTNVNASDLLVNGVPATGLSSSTNTTYTFSFAQPPYGPVTVTWAADAGIMDFDTVPKAFDGAAAIAILRYTLVNPSAPIVVARTPIASMTITGLTSIQVTFSEPVAGVSAADLLVNGVPATSLSVPPGDGGSNYIFAFVQPAFGTVTVRFATNSGIQDLEVPSSELDFARPANQWTYTLINPVPTVAISALANNGFALQGVNVTVNATATDNDGTITSVDFRLDGTSVLTDSNAPYSTILSNLALGSYVLQAIATDNTGIRATSAPVVLNVVDTLPIVLLRGPYLLNGSSTGGVVRWRTDQFSDGVVRYGTDLNNLSNVAVETALTNNHVVRLSGLQPDTKYFYSFGSSSFNLGGGTNIGGSNFWFTTSPVVGTPKPTRLWVLGDPGTANNNQRAVRDAFNNYAATNGRLTDLWLMLGDNAYNTGTDTEYQAAVFDMYPTTLRNHFLWPVIGNHDAQQPGSPGGTAANFTTHFPYLDMFNTPRNGEAGGVPSGSPKYYSLDYGNIHLVGLDSMTSSYETNGVMAEWLKSDLAANTQTWTIVYFHHPPYTKGSHNSDTEQDLVRMRQNFNPIFEANNVDLVLSGHSHCYERSYLLNGHYGLSTTFNSNTMTIGGDSNGSGNGREDGTGAYRKNAAREGTVYSVAGSAGQATGGTLNHPAHSISLNELGSVIIDVASNRLDMKFLNSTGVERDHLTLLKREPTFAPVGLVINGNGTVAGASNGELLEIGRTYTLVATPGSGSIFANWSGGVSSTESTLQFVMQSNLVIVANFVPGTGPQFAPLTLTINGNGTVAGAAHGQLLQIGNSYTLVATPGSGSVFVNWAGGVSEISSTLNFVMQSNLVIVANFAPEGTGPRFDRLILTINGDGTVSGATNGEILQIGNNYTLVATPGEGSVFVNWSGGVSELSPTLNFVMQSNLTIIATFEPDGIFRPLAGVFNGLFFEIDQVQPRHSGFFTLRLLPTGRYTATLTTAGKQYQTRGRFNEEGRAVNQIARGNAGPLTVTWEANPQDADVLSGSVTDGEWVAPLYGDRAVFNSGNPAPQAGKYTLVIPGTRAVTALPAGDGYATATIDANGVVRLKGQLADGRALSHRATLSKNGDWPFYESFYWGHGVALGWLHFADDGTNDVSGTIRWVRPNIPTGHLYPDGFEVNSAVIGSRYTPPTGTESVLQITDGVAIFNGGNLPDSSNAFTFGPNSKLVNHGPHTLKLTFDPASGAFRGTFKETGTTRTFPVRGAVLQRQNIGSGHVLGPDQSGWILIQNAP